MTAHERRPALPASCSCAKSAEGAPATPSMTACTMRTAAPVCADTVESLAASPCSVTISVSNGSVQLLCRSWRVATCGQRWARTRG